jgi:hypothetical protein
MAAFWDIPPCSLQEVDRRLRSVYGLYYQGHHRPDNGGSSTSETSVNFLQTTRSNIPEGCLSSSYSSLWEPGISY